MSGVGSYISLLSPRSDSGLGLGSLNGNAGRSKPRSGAGAGLFGIARDDDPLVRAEDELFHRRVVSVLLMVGVIMLLFVGASAIITLEAPQELTASAADGSALQGSATDTQPHNPNDAYAALDRSDSTQSIPSIPPRFAVAAPVPGASDGSIRTPRRRPAPTPLSQDHSESVAQALAEAQAADARTAALAADHAQQSGSPAELTRLQRMIARVPHAAPPRSAEEQAAEDEEEELDVPVPAAVPASRSRAEISPRRRYGPIGTHQLTRHVDLFASDARKARPLAQLRQRSIVSLADPDATHAGHVAANSARTRIFFQPRDLRAGLDGPSRDQSPAEQMAALREAMSQSHNPSSIASEDHDLLGEGWVDSGALAALAPERQRRFALPQSPPYSRSTGEPLPWEPSSDHGEVWYVQQQH